MSEAPAVARSPRQGRRKLGELLVLRGLLEEEDVNSALLEQRRCRQRLGQILVARGRITPSDLLGALAEQQNGSREREHGFGSGLRGAIEGSYDRRHESTAARTQPLGELLVARGSTPPTVIASALEEQASTGRRLGEILIDRGAVSRSALSKALTEQARGPETEEGFGSGLRKRLSS